MNASTLAFLAAVLVFFAIAVILGLLAGPFIQRLLDGPTR